METEKMPIPKVIVTTAKPTEPATLPRTREGFAIKQQQIHLIREELKTDAVEVKTIVSSHFIICHSFSFVMSHCAPDVPFNCLTDQQNIKETVKFSPVPPVEVSNSSCEKRD